MRKFHNTFTFNLLKYSAPVFPKKWRILITGVTSIHGWPIFRLLNKRIGKKQIWGIRSPKMTIPSDNNVTAACVTDRDTLLRIKQTFNPTHIIYCSGLCDLDACEAKPEWTYDINVGGPKTVMDIFGNDKYFMFCSVDLVFSGDPSPASGYTETHPPDPVSVVGKTFYAAENIVKKYPKYSIIRLGLPIGDSVTGDKGAVDFIEKRLKKNLPLTLFYDELRSCLECDEIAWAISWSLFFEIQGIYHLGGDDTISLYSLGKEVLRRGRYNPNTLDTKSFREDLYGPPRIGDVSLNSFKLESKLRKNIKKYFCGEKDHTIYD